MHFPCSFTNRTICRKFSSRVGTILFHCINIYDFLALLAPSQHTQTHIKLYISTRFLQCHYYMAIMHGVVDMVSAAKTMRHWLKDENMNKLDCVMLRRKILGYPRDMNNVTGG